MPKRRLYIPLIALLLAVFAFSLYMIVSQLTEEKRSADRFEELRKAVLSAKTDTGEKNAGTDAGMEKTVLPCYLTLSQKNPDLFGWIKIDGTPVDYPVMYTPRDPERYLHRDFDGRSSAAGVPFVDGNCDPGGNYLIVYGHHMKNGSMFGTLPSYRSDTYRQAHRRIFFDTLYEKREYEVMAVFNADVGETAKPGEFRYYTYFDLSDPETFEEYIKNVKAVSLYDTGITAEYGDRILVLSTCSYHTENGRFIVVAKSSK